jgi:hypothetical protein
MLVSAVNRHVALNNAVNGRERKTIYGQRMTYC